MRKKRTRRVVIGHRDIELFSYLYEVKAATAAQVKREIFSNVTRSVVYTRLKKLIHMNYIKRSLFFKDNRAISAYSLSKTALRKFIFSDREEHALKRSLSDSIVHDVALNDIRHKLLNCEQVIDYYSENVLNSSASFVTADEFKSFRKVHSDGMIMFKKGDDTFNVAIEYEHTLKYTQRYRDLFFRYMLERDIVAVLYICKDEKVLTRVTRAYEKSSTGNREMIYFTTLDEFYSNPKKTIFRNPNGKDIVSIC